jgi:hypothetical protein
MKAGGIAILGAALTSAVLLASAGTAMAELNPDACGVIGSFKLAKALGLADVAEHKTVLREPGTSAGVIHLRCDVLAWRKHRPGTARREREEILAGEASTLRMETWIPDEGPAGETWRANFVARVHALTSNARKRFTGFPLGGHSVAIPKSGAEHSIGFLVNTGSLVKLKAFWWKDGKATIIAMSAVEAKGSPIVRSVGSIADIVVPAIHGAEDPPLVF